MAWRTWEAPNAIICIWISFKNMFFTCDQLGNYMLLNRHCRFFSQTMNSNLRLCLLRVINWTGNLTGPWWKIVQSCMWLNQSKCKCGSAWQQNTAIIYCNKNVTWCIFLVSRGDLIKKTWSNNFHSICSVSAHLQGTRSKPFQIRIFKNQLIHTS